MRQKHCPSWSPEEIEELRRSLQTSHVAEVDAFMFGKRFSQIISGGLNPTDAPVNNNGTAPDTARLGGPVTATTF